MSGHLCDPVTLGLHCELVMSLFLLNIYFKSKDEHYRKIEATSATNLEHYTQVRLVVHSINSLNLSADFRRTCHCTVFGDLYPEVVKHPSIKSPSRRPQTQKNHTLCD